MASGGPAEPPDDTKGYNETNAARVSKRMRKSLTQSVFTLTPEVIEQQLDFARDALEKESTDPPIVSFDDLKRFLFESIEVKYAEIPPLISKYTTSPVGMVNLLNSIRWLSTVSSSFKSRLSKPNTHIKRHYQLMTNDFSSSSNFGSLNDLEVTS